MLERLLTFWKGKLFVLVLLGFAATDFIITITLSAADAAAHVVENPHMPAFTARPGDRDHDGPGGAARRGLPDAVSPRPSVSRSRWCAPISLSTLVVIAVSFWHVFEPPHVIGDWTSALTEEHGNPVMMVAHGGHGLPQARPRHVRIRDRRRRHDPRRRRARRHRGDPAGRIRQTKKLLATAAIIMSVFLITSSLVTTWLIPAEEFEEGGKASGRALAYLAHLYLGDVFGTVYDASTIAILWFAGASAMAGLLNLVPRYLPRYGMAPEWSAAVRPLVLVLTAIAFLSPGSSRPTSTPRAAPTPPACWCSSPPPAPPSPSPRERPANAG